MKSKLFTLVFIISLVGTAVKAQEFPYSFTTYNETYTPIVGGTDLMGGEVWDDPEVFVPIGFDFTLFGNTTDELLLLPPGAQVVTGIVKGSLTDLLMPYFADVMNADTLVSVSPILYSLEGEPGNLIFKMQWTNVGFYGELFETETFTNTTNFQLWLYQNGNVVEYRYGDNTVDSPEVVHFIGAPGCLIGSAVALDGSEWGGLWSLAGDPSNPNLVAIPSGMQDFTEQQILSAEPPSGTVYRFGDFTSSVQEVKSEDIVLWPNPAKDAIRILSNSSQQFWVYDQIGKEVLNGKLMNQNNTIDLSNLNAGTYIVRTESGLAKQFIKL